MMMIIHLLHQGVDASLALSALEVSQERPIDMRNIRTATEAFSNAERCS
jgi:hypothetical protein